MLMHICGRHDAPPAAIKGPTPWSVDQHAIIAKLPQELIDGIIDQLQDDKQALAACSLVCRTWTLRTRHYLFTKFTLNGKKLKTFPKSGSAVMPFIRHFSVVNLSTARHRNKFLPLLVGFDQADSLLSSSNIGIRWQALKSQSRSSLLQNFCAVVCLNLDCIRAKHVAEVASIICAFPCLQTLVVRHLTCSVPSRNQPPLRTSNHALSTSLCHLELLGFQAELLLEWFLSFETLPALCTVYLRELDDRADKRSITRRFLQAVGPTLESLCCNSYLHEEFQHLVRSNNTPRLKELHIVLRANNGQFDTNVLTFVDSLSRMPSVNLDQVAIYHTEQVRVAWEEWLIMDNVLSLPQFANLKKLNICFLAIDLQGTTSAVPTTALPRCLSRGLVHIQVVDSLPTYL